MSRSLQSSALLCMLLLLLPLPGCNYSRVTKLSNGVDIRLGKPHLKIEVCSDRIFHVVYAANNEFSKEKSLILGDKKWDPVSFGVVDNGNEILVSTAQLKAKVKIPSGEVSFYDANNKLLLKEKQGGGRSITPVEVNGVKTSNIEQEFETSPGEALYGLGQHQDRLLNIKDYDLFLYQHNREVFIPFLVSSRGYGILWHNYSLTTFGNPGDFQNIDPAQLFDRKGAGGKLSLELFADKEMKIPLPNKGYNSEAINISLAPDTVVQAARWTGEIKTIKAGEYILMNVSDGSFSCSVDGKEVLNNWSPFLRARDVARVKLEANRKYKIAIEWTKENNSSRMIFKWRQPVDRHNMISLWSQSGSQVDYYFMSGKTMDDVIADYREATGTAPVMPKWGMGFWQCRERYKSQQEVLGIVKEFRTRHVPLDVVVQDWQYWRYYEWGSHLFDTIRYPDVKGMLDELHTRLHARFMISVWCKFYPGTANFQELEDAGYLYPGLLNDSLKDFLGNHYTYYDAFNPGARKMYWDQINRNLFSKGVDAWWLDASEPETPDNNTQASDIARYMNPTYLGPGVTYLNAYPLMTCKGVYEGQRETAPNQRVCILTRSAFAGMQKYGTTVWSGDIAGRWDVLKASIPAGLSFCLSGFPYWTTDIGGFSVNYPGGNKNEEYRELFTRWYQFGAFCPVFRVHGTNTPREIWFFGDRNSKFYKTQLTFDRLRYSLMPYLYSMAGMVNRRHYTIMRALVMDFANDPRALDIPDQYMFGPAFLVNPVTDYHAVSRQVYLPKSAGWYDFWSGAFYDAGQSVNAGAPLESMPLFVKAGSIIPFGPEIQYSDEKPADPITLRIYEGADASFTLYEDENTNYNYEKGKFLEIPIRWNEKSKTLTIDKQQGTFDGMLASRTFKLIFVSVLRPRSSTYNLPDRVIRYKGERIELKL